MHCRGLGGKLSPRICGLVVAPKGCGVMARKRSLTLAAAAAVSMCVPRFVQCSSASVAIDIEPRHVKPAIIGHAVSHSFASWYETLRGYLRFLRQQVRKLCSSTTHGERMISELESAGELPDCSLIFFILCKTRPANDPRKPPEGHI